MSLSKPTLKSLKLEYFGISEIGLVRTNNEDVWAALPEKQFFILADGMGGHKAGEVASSLAVEKMCESIHGLTHDISVEKACQLLRESIAKANAKIFEESHCHSDYAGMGTTLSCFMILENFLIYGHIGDSRLYRYRDKIEQLTQDHSLRHHVVLEKETARPSNLILRNLITRAIGTQAAILPDIGVIALHPKDIYMLCSDGLSDQVHPDQLAKILSSSDSLQRMGKNLVKLALEKGGNDNITLLLVRIL